MYEKTFVFVLITFISLILKADTEDLPFFLSKNDMFINESNVCDDFYDYSCGKWASTTTRPSHEPVWGHWQEVSHSISERLHDILMQTNESGPAINKARIFYKSCLKADKFDKKYLRQLRRLVDFLIDDNFKENWIMNVITVTKIFNIHPLVKIYSALDFRNTTQKILYIERGNLVLPPVILSNPEEYPQQIKAYREWITETIRHLNKKSGNGIDAKVKKIIEFEAKLAKISFIKRNRRRLTIGELTKLIPLDWVDVLKNISVDNDSGVNSHTIIATDLNYLQKLFMLTKKTDKEQIVNYITWSVIKDLSRDTSSHFRHLNFLIDKAILGVDSDIPRRQECTNHITNYFSYALIKPYVDRHLKKETLTSVENMSRDIRGEFVKMLKKNTWMSEQTKSKAIEKVIAIKYLIGYPEWATNVTSVNKHYEKVNISENHFANMIELKSFASRNGFAAVDETKELWLPSSPFEVNAYYSILQNMIIIPLGLLEPPFFDMKRHTSFNYGAIGSLIGHEISHSLDNIGRHSDKKGNLANWWSKLDVYKFNMKAQCFSDKTKDFLLQAETIADDVGLRLSLSAYENLKHGKTVNKSSSLEKFFTAYAQLWCELLTQSQFVNDDEHSPVKTRVLKTLRNNKHFADVFNCTQNRNICELW